MPGMFAEKGFADTFIVQILMLRLLSYTKALQKHVSVLYTRYVIMMSTEGKYNTGEGNVKCNGSGDLAKMKKILKCF